MTKKVTLPIGCLGIFEELAIAALEIEDREPDDIQAFMDNVIYELGEEAYLHSFTPSGEMGSNPATPRIAETFYDNFPEIFGAMGWFQKQLKGKDQTVINNKILQYKAAVVSLIRLYMETVFDLKVRGKKDAPHTSFDYPKLPEGATSKEDYKQLVEVEKNRYLQLSIATLFTKVMHEIFKTPPSVMKKIIESNDLWGVQGITDPEEQFKLLRRPENRRKFVENLAKNLSVSRAK